MKYIDDINKNDSIGVFVFFGIISICIIIVMSYGFDIREFNDGILLVLLVICYGIMFIAIDTFKFTMYFRVALLTPICTIAAVWLAHSNLKTLIILGIVLLTMMEVWYWYFDNAKLKKKHNLITFVLVRKLVSFIWSFVVLSICINIYLIVANIFKQPKIGIIFILCLMAAAFLAGLITLWLKWNMMKYEGKRK